MLRSPLHWLLSFGLMLITVTGRRTGRVYTIPVGYQRDGDVITVLVSDAATKQWWRNFHDPARVRVRIRGKNLEGIGEVISPDSAEFRLQSERTLRRLPFMGKVFGIDYRRAQGLTDLQVVELGKRIAMVQIRVN